MKSCPDFTDSHLLLKNGTLSCAHDPLDSIWIPNSSPTFHGAASMMNFEQARGERRKRTEHSDCSSSREEDCDEELNHRSTEKKRRLSSEQVRFLEKSFEVENKLEPDRKNQLAKELGLQPRQVAIWFQNRRARSKTKVLEKEYDSLKSCFDKLKADYDAVFSDNDKLRNEVNLLRQKLVMKENDPISPLDFATSKPEEASSYSSHVAEPERSDLCQDEDECLVQSLCLPKLEAEYYDDDLQPNSCNLGFPVQNQGTWFWQC